nr:MAG TPA: Dec protein, OB-Fold, Decoration, VIRAL PROTEIN [Caudoviricetes sp.]
MAYEKFTGEEYIDTDLVAKLNQDFDACGKLASKNTWSADNDFTAGLTVNKIPTVNADVSNKKYVDDSIANGDVNSAKYLNITNFIPSNSDFNDYKTPGEYQVQSNIEANTIANLPTSYNDTTPRSGVLSVLIGFNAPRTSLIQIYRTYGSSYIVSRTYQRCFYHENSSWTAWREIACTDEVGLLNQANTYTALNTFRASIGVSNGTAAGSSGTVSFGVPPTGETVQARIGTDNLGGLFYHASTNQPHVFRVGTNNNVFVIRDDDTKVAFSSNNNFFATVTHDGVAKWLGNANTATKLATARTITANLASSTAGSFDGSANITVGVTGTLPIANGGTGATTAAAARTALGCAPAYTYSTTDLTAGSSALTTGTLYIVYE